MLRANVVNTSSTCRPQSRTCKVLFPVSIDGLPAQAARCI